MSPSERLRKARTEAGFKTAAAFAQVLNVDAVRYRQWENSNSNGWTEFIFQIADRCGVSARWLALGQGPMRETRRQRHIVPIVAYVGAADRVEPLTIQDPPEDEGVDWLTGDDFDALKIVGESGRPRFEAGEVILVERRARLPEELVGEYAVVMTHDGRTLLKQIRRGSRRDLFDLESFNAGTERDVMIIGARKIRAILTAETRIPPGRRIRLGSPPAKAALPPPD